MTHSLAAKLGLIWCPLCYEGMRGRSSHRGHFGFRERLWQGEKRWMALQKRGRVTSDSQSGGQAPVGDGLSVRWPHVFEFLSLLKWPDGSSRATGTVMLLTEGGSWKIWAHDRDSSEGLFVSARSPEAALDQLEGVLSDGGGDWRPDKSSRSGRK
jgi:hypothetical protein